MTGAWRGTGRPPVPSSDALGTAGTAGTGAVRLASGHMRRHRRHHSRRPVRRLTNRARSPSGRDSWRVLSAETAAVQVPAEGRRIPHGFPRLSDTERDKSRSLTRRARPGPVTGPDPDAAAARLRQAARRRVGPECGTCRGCVNRSQLAAAGSQPASRVPADSHSGH